MEFKNILTILITPFLALGYSLVVITGLVVLSLLTYLTKTIFGDLL